MRIKLLLVSTTLIYLTVRYFTTPFYNVDFPCYYELKNGILSSETFPADSAKDLIIFLSDFPEHSSGGGCFETSIQQGKSTEYLNHRFELKDKNVIIDNNLLKIGDKRTTKKATLKLINLWWIYDKELKIKNHGYISGIKRDATLTKLEYPRLFVAGYVSTKEKFNYYTAIIFIGLTIYLVYLIVENAKRRKQKSPNR